MLHSSTEKKKKKPNPSSNTITIWGTEGKDLDIWRFSGEDAFQPINTFMPSKFTTFSLFLLVSLKLDPSSLPTWNGLLNSLLFHCPFWVCPCKWQSPCSHWSDFSKMHICSDHILDGNDLWFLSVHGLASTNFSRFCSHTPTLDLCTRHAKVLWAPPRCRTLKLLQTAFVTCCCVCLFLVCDQVYKKLLLITSTWQVPCSELPWESHTYFWVPKLWLETSLTPSLDTP